MTSKIILLDNIGDHKFENLMFLPGTMHSKAQF